MRRIPVILFLVLGATLLVRQIHAFFVEDEGVHYYAVHPLSLLYVLVPCILGGIVALSVSRLSPASQRALKLLALGGFGALLVGGLGFFAYLLYFLFKESAWH